MKTKTEPLAVTPEALAACRALVEHGLARLDAQVRCGAPAPDTLNRFAEAKPLDRSRLWSALVCSILTTQQQTPPPSTLFPPLEESVEITADWTASAEASGRLEERLLLFCRSRGFRYGAQKARFIAGAWRTLEDAGTWPILEAAVGILQNAAPTLVRERAAANAVEGLIEGLGAKQSRSFLHRLGLGRCVVVIDARFYSVLSSLGFKGLPSALDLQRRAAYLRVEDLANAICLAMPDFALVPAQFEALARLESEREPTLGERP